MLVLLAWLVWPAACGREPDSGPADSGPPAPAASTATAPPAEAEPEVAPSPTRPAPHDTPAKPDASPPRLPDYVPLKHTPVDAAPIALYQLLKARGCRAAGYTRIRDAWTRRPRAVTPLEMKAVLETQGVKARIRKQPIAAVLDAHQPAVLLLGPTGKDGLPLFTQPVLCLGRRDGAVHLVDPTRGACLVPEPRLASLHAGADLRIESPGSFPAIPGPDLVLDEILWHYGTVPAGARIHHSFRIRNQGTGPLAVSHVETTCGCAAALMSDRDEISSTLRSRARAEKDDEANRRVLQQDAGGTIPAGEARWITAYVNTLYKKGERNFGVRFRTSDPDEPECVVILAGRIQQVYELEPATVWFQDVPAGQGASAHLWLRHHEGQPIQVTELGASDPFITLNVDPDPPRQARRPRNAVEARLVPSRAHPARDGWVGLRVRVLPNAPAGTFSAILRLTVDGLPLEASASGRVRGHLRIRPEVINLGRLRPGQTARANVTVSSASRRSFRIDRIEASPSFLRAALETEEPGLYRIRVSLAPGWSAPRLEGRIVIHSNDPLEPRKVIGVHGFVTR